MDTAGLFHLPGGYDALEADLLQVDAAIEMVARGAAVRVRLVGLSDPDTLAPIALARAQYAGVDFRIDRGATATLTFGPSD
jgi:hypothetical protein